MFNKEIALKQAENHLKNNRIPAAIEEYQNIFQATKDLNTLNILGDLYIRIGDNPKAIKSFLPIAESYAQDGLIVKAIAMYKKLQKLAPTDINLLSKLAELHVKKKFFGDARLYYTQLLEIYKQGNKPLEAIKILQAIVDINPENLPNRMELAKAYQAEGLFTEAHDIYLETGQMLLKLGIINEAVDLFQKAFSIAHNPSPALQHLVETLAQNNQIDKAVQLLAKEIGKNPNNIDLLIMLGKTYLLADKLDLAEKAFIALVHKDASRYEYLLRISSLFLAEKQFDRAVNAITPIMDTILKNKQKRKVTSILKEILKQDSNHIPTLNSLVYIYQKLEENSNLSTTLKLLVKACLNNGATYEAITTLQELIKLEPSNNAYKEKLENLEKGSITKELKNTGSLTKTNLPKPQTNNLPPTKASEDPDSTKSLMEGMLSIGTSYADAQLQLLESMIAMDPDYWEARVKLKNAYLQKNLLEQATEQCIEIAKIHKTLGDLDSAQKMLAEAFSLSPNRKAELLELGLKESKPKREPTLEEILPTPIVTATTPISNNIGLENSLFEIDLSSIFASAETPSTQTSSKTQTNLDTQASFINIEAFCQANKIIDKEWKRAIRNDQEISLIAIKIDNYLEKLKFFGQPFLQECLSSMSSTIEENINDGGEQLLNCDIADTLIILLPETSLAQAATVAKKIHDLMLGLKPFQHPISLSISQALASLKPSATNSPNMLVEKMVSNIAKLLSPNQIISE